MRYESRQIKTVLAAIGMTVFVASGCGVDPEITVIPTGALIVDVRTPKEFNSGHYPGAVNIPADTIGRRIEEFGAKDRPIVVYCRSGRRSTSAKKQLKNIGFSSVYNGGGIKAFMRIPPSEASPSP